MTFTTTEHEQYLLGGFYSEVAAMDFPVASLTLLNAASPCAVELRGVARERLMAHYPKPTDKKGKEKDIPREEALGNWFASPEYSEFSRWALGLTLPHPKMGY